MVWYWYRVLKVDLRKHPQGTRFVVLKAIDQLMAKHRDGKVMLPSSNVCLLTEVTVLKKLGDPFIDGFIELIGGEKDPRNLMIVFSLLKVIIIEFDTERHTEVRLPHSSTSIFY